MMSNLLSRNDLCHKVGKPHSEDLSCSDGLGFPFGSSADLNAIEPWQYWWMGDDTSFLAKMVLLPCYWTFHKQVCNIVRDYSKRLAF